MGERAWRGPVDQSFSGLGVYRQTFRPGVAGAAGALEHGLERIAIGRLEHGAQARQLVAIGVELGQQGHPIGSADVAPHLRVTAGDAGEITETAGRMREQHAGIVTTRQLIQAVKAAGFKCMGFRPATRYALPATAFKVGSAEIPDSLKVQLEVFADVLRQRRGSGKQVRIEGHADASGSATANAALSQKRAESVRDFLVARGADPAMLSSVGLGSAVPKSGTDPFSPENRRVEIGRADAAK